MTKVTDMNDFMDRKVRQEVGFTIDEGWLEPTVLDGEKAYTITKKGLEIVAKVISVAYMSDACYGDIDKEEMNIIEYGDQLIQNQGNVINFLLSASLEMKEMGVVTTKDFHELMEEIVMDLEERFGSIKND